MDSLKFFLTGIFMLHLYVGIGVFLYRTAQDSGGKLFGFGPTHPHDDQHELVMAVGVCWPATVTIAVLRAWVLLWFKWLPDWYASRMSALADNLDAPPRAVAREVE